MYNRLAGGWEASASESALQLCAPDVAYQLLDAPIYLGDAVIDSIFSANGAHNSITVIKLG